MLIAIIKDNTVEKIGDYRELFPGTSFGSNGPTDDWLQKNSCAKVNVYRPYNVDTEKLTGTDPYIEGGWVYTVQVSPLTPAELEARKTQLSAIVRLDRNQRLTACDWTQLADSPTDKAAWARYRQNLRDITQQLEFPYNVEWPVSPDALLKTEE